MRKQTRNTEKNNDTFVNQKTQANIKEQDTIIKQQTNKKPTSSIKSLTIKQVGKIHQLKQRMNTNYSLGKMPLECMPIPTRNNVPKRTISQKTATTNPA